MAPRCPPRLPHVPSSTTSVTAVVPAKINLALSVGPVRVDGFHELATVYQAVGLYDEVTVTRRNPGSGISMTVAGVEADAVPCDETNLAWQAARVVAAEADTDPDVHIHIVKRIPVAGGMAGGSADAAGALLACDILWRASLHRERMLELAAELGSDVPFLLHGGTAVGTSRGECITSAMARGAYHWVFALSDRGLSTPRVYAECDRLRTGAKVVEPVIPAGLMEVLLNGFDQEPTLGEVWAHPRLSDAMAMGPVIEAFRADRMPDDVARALVGVLVFEEDGLRLDGIRAIAGELGLR